MKRIIVLQALGAMFGSAALASSLNPINKHRTSNPVKMRQLSQAKGAVISNQEIKDVAREEWNNQVEAKRQAKLARRNAKC